MGLTSVELFAGGGGLLLGCARAGIDTVLAAERDGWSCNTLRHNRDTGHRLFTGLNVHEGDVRDIAWSDYEGVDLVVGGPPCQPFSLGGKAAAHDDDRDMFPATASVVEQVRPRAFVLENVKGLMRARFAEYFETVLLRMTMPELAPRADEEWHDHRSRLLDSRATYDGLRYDVSYALVDAADYGVPQRRHRVVIVGLRSGLGLSWSPPTPTHSLDALLHDQWVTGGYWDRHGVALHHRPSQTPQVARRVARARECGPGNLASWKTLRDALNGLPEPGTSGVPDHEPRPGARVYSGHTGSPLDMPSKAIKAGVHGVPGGENMLLMPDGSVRYLTVREAARIQTFPDDYVFGCPWGEAMRQLGNAVPVRLADGMARSVTDLLLRP